jgi:hypothetical protein
VNPPLMPASRGKRRLAAVSCPGPRAHSEPAGSSTTLLGDRRCTRLRKPAPIIEIRPTHVGARRPTVSVTSEPGSRFSRRRPRGRARLRRGRPRGWRRAAGRSPLSGVAFLPPVCPVPRMFGTAVPSPATTAVAQVPAARSATISTATSAGNALLFVSPPRCFSFSRVSVPPFCLPLLRRGVPA